MSASEQTQEFAAMLADLLDTLPPLDYATNDTALIERVNEANAMLREYEARRAMEELRGRKP